MRLDKFLSHATGLSRTQSRRAIKSATVTVNNAVTKDTQREVSENDTVSLEGKPLSLPGALYFMMNKPSGYVCATTDSDHPTIMDLLTTFSAGTKATLSVAGRLDKDTTGLVLLSNDGQWVHRITSPRHEHPKTYRVTLERDVSDEDIELFSQGIMLRNEKRSTRPAALKPLPGSRAEVIIREGRYHQVKRMFAATGNRVRSLHRYRIGAIELDEALAPGAYRPLTDWEVTSA